MKALHASLLVLAASTLALGAAPMAQAQETQESSMPESAVSTTPAVGQAAPDFSLPSTSGDTLTLSSLKGKTVVLYFYPKDETPGCTHEACDFRDHTAALDSAGVVVLGVSNDDIKSHLHFQTKEHLSFPLLADVDASVSKAYGVYGEQQYGDRKYTGIRRTTFVIDTSGNIARVWPSVNVNGHVEEVLAFVRGN